MKIIQSIKARVILVMVLVNIIAMTGHSQVVINEVAWAGTAGFPANLANDKWLELYNNTDSPINISD